MTERKVGVTDVASGAGVADYRTREQAALGCEQYLIPEVDRVLGYRGMVATFRIIGNTTAAGLPLATLFNKTASGVLVAVTRLEVVYEQSLPTSTVRGYGVSPLTIAPTDGALMTPVPFDTDLTHNALVEFRGKASADGTNVAFTPVAVIDGWRIFTQRMVSDYGQRLNTPLPLIPDHELPVYLEEGNGLVVAQPETQGSSASFLINCVFEEFIL